MNSTTHIQHINFNGDIHIHIHLAQPIKQEEGEWQMPNDWLKTDDCSPQSQSNPQS